MTKNKFNFIDLCCGIGGFRLGMESIGGNCILSSDIDAKVQALYKDIFNFDENEELFVPDLFDIPLDLNKPIDVLCAGFPCQPFSIAGSKGGFDDPRGNVFFGILNIVKAYKPRVVFLENVRNLLYHDDGKTMRTIINLLISAGYSVDYRLWNTNQFGLPQNRERVYIVATRDKPFKFDKIQQEFKSGVEEYITEKNYLDPESYSLNPKELWEYQENSGLTYVGYVRKTVKLRKTFTSVLQCGAHSEKVRIYHSDGNVPCAVASTKTYQLYDGKGVYQVIPEDLLAIQGFPRNHLDKTDDKSLKFKTIGNSVCPKITTEIAKELRNQEII